ncbi:MULTISPECIES: hypothetical protein [Butyricimonas]|uniref:hypothetical protein n=2 Tax=Butyricimonas TaxID=574697 RepID=UPI0007FB5398|nr:MULTISPECIES: hypothetical protein [Butyricimonas]
MSYNAPFGSEDYPYCPWHGNSGASDLPLQDKCVFCEELVDDEDCKVIHGLVFCNECLKAIEEHGDGIEEEIKHFLTSNDLCKVSPDKVAILERAKIWKHLKIK